MYSIVYDKNTLVIKRVYGSKIDEQNIEQNELVHYARRIPPIRVGSTIRITDQNTTMIDPPNIIEESTAQEKIEQIERAVQAYLDKEARAKGYDSILSACSYAAYANPFQAEGQAFVKWRGDVWQYCYDQLAEIEAGNRSEPTMEAFMAELPAYVPPA